MDFSRRGAIEAAIVTSASTLAAPRIVGAVESQSGASCGPLVNVTAFGAVGNGAADDTAAIQAAVDDCFGTSSNPHSGVNAHLNKPLYFPAGIYRTSAPIILTNVRGGHIFGAGRFTTMIKNSRGTSVFRTNGFEFSRVEMLQLSAVGNQADVFDLDWTNGGGTALQSNTFADVFFDGGAIGVNIGKSDFMGSENLFLNCFFNRHGTAGLKTSNFNALQNTLVGGNIQSCSVGVWIRAGSCSVYNTGFQICNTFDIAVDNSANDSMVISGSRSESPSFARFRNGVTAHIVGCSHSSNDNGTFADIDGCQVAIDSCVSLRGVVKGQGIISVRNTCFGRDDWIDSTSMRSGAVEVQNCYVGGTRNSGFRGARLISRRTLTPAGSHSPLQRMLVDIKPEFGKLNIPIAAGTRIRNVTLILDKPASSGVIWVGDKSNASRYFAAANLTGSTSVSPVIEHRYQSADTLIVEYIDAPGVSGSVAVDFVADE